MSLEFLRTVFSGFTLVSVIFVALNYWLSKTKAKNDAVGTRDKEICEQAIISLERAHRSLTLGSLNYSLPEASRLNWLTSARQIVRFKELKSMLKTDLYKLICSEHEDHWKHEFYLSLKHNEFMSSQYFESNNIQLKSALVIMNFKQWSSNVDDPLESIDGKKLASDNYTLLGQHGLEACIREANPQEYR